MKYIHALVLALCLVPATFAAQLGDAAAPLQISAWAKGKPVDLADLKGKHVAVVEFWATWCGPCLQSIPHLTELQKKFKDVVFIGVSNEDPDTVKKFVAKMGDKMDYTVAVDQDNKTSDGYLTAFGFEGSIPHAFIVDKTGHVIWVGHPMDQLEEVLEKVEAGKYDLQTAKNEQLLNSKYQEFLQLAVTNEKDPALDKVANEIAGLEKQLGKNSPEEKFDAAKVIQGIHFKRAMMAYQQAVADGKSGADLDQITAYLAAVAPPGFQMNDYKAFVALRYNFGEYYEAVTGGADKDTIANLAKKVASQKTTNAAILNDIAFTILSDEKITNRDLTLATQFAKASVEASGEQDAVPLDTYAHALFASGNTADAIAWEKKAIAVTKDDAGRKDAQDALQQFQSAAKAK